MSGNSTHADRRVFGLDLLRACAILAVLVYHAGHAMPGLPGALGSVFARGWSGVDLFFVLSGFLVGSQALAITRNSFPAQVRSFWIKRWTRTLPLYFPVLFFYVLVKPWLFHAPFVGGFNWRFLFFLQNSHILRDFGQSWSLCVEEQFYLILPLVVLVLGKRRPALLWLLPLAASTSLRLYFAEAYKAALAAGQVSPDQFLHLFRMRTGVILDSISVGVFLAATRARWQAFRLSTKRWIGVAGLFLFFATTASFVEMPAEPFAIAVQYTALAVAFGALLVWLEGVREPIRGLGWLHFIALWSYSAYLWHPAVLRLVVRVVHTGSLSQLAAYLAISLALSWISYSAIEKPGLKLRRLALRRPAASPLPLS